MKRGWIIHMMGVPRTFNQFDFFCPGWSAYLLTLPDFRWDLVDYILRKEKTKSGWTVLHSSWLCWLWKLGLISGCHGGLTKPTIQHILEKFLSSVQIGLIGAAFLSLLIKLKGSITKWKRQTWKGSFCQILHLFVPESELTQTTNPLTKKKKSIKSMCV